MPDKVKNARKKKTAVKKVAPIAPKNGKDRKPRQKK